MTISTALQGVIMLQVIAKTVSQYPFPFPPGSPQMMSNMAPLPPGPAMPPQQFLQQPMSFPMQQKMPMVVMPYYSKSVDKAQKKARRKRRRHNKIHFDDSSSEDDDSEASGEFEYRAKGKFNRRRQVLTPVVSYVTKDGYVVYQKKIKKDKARDWLEMGKRTRDSPERDDNIDEREELLRKFKMLKHSKKHHKDRNY